MTRRSPPPYLPELRQRAVRMVAEVQGAHDTGGAVSVVEHPVAVGALFPPHLHTREDEYSIVTEGEIGFRSNDREVVLAAGGYITNRRGRCTRGGTLMTLAEVPQRC